MTPAKYPPVRCTLRVPDPGVNLGGLVRLDPLALLGLNLDELLGPHCVGRAQRQAGDERWLEYEMRIPHGEGNAVQVPVLGGELGFGSQQGFLVLRVPMRLAYDVSEQLRGRVRVISGQAMVPTDNGHAADFFLDPRGALEFQLGPVGKVGVTFPEAG